MSLLKNELSKLMDRKDLSEEEVESVWKTIMTTTDWTQVESVVAIGALLLLLRSKGESPAEIAGSVVVVIIIVVLLLLLLLLLLFVLLLL